MARAKNEKITLEALKEAIDARARELGKAKVAELREKYEILKRLQDKTPKTKEDVVEAMKKVLCFSNIAYCCGTPLNPHGEGKQCPFRDGFLDALGLTYEDYEKFKSECDDLFWRTIGGCSH